MELAIAIRRLVDVEKILMASRKGVNPTLTGSFGSTMMLNIGGFVKHLHSHYFEWNSIDHVFVAP